MKPAQGPAHAQCRTVGEDSVWNAELSHELRVSGEVLAALDRDDQHMSALRRRHAAAEVGKPDPERFLVGGAFDQPDRGGEQRVADVGVTEEPAVLADSGKVVADVVDNSHASGVAGKADVPDWCRCRGDRHKVRAVGNHDRLPSAGTVDEAAEESPLRHGAESGRGLVEQQRLRRLRQQQREPGRFDEALAGQPQRNVGNRAARDDGGHDRCRGERPARWVWCLDRLLHHIEVGAGKGAKRVAGGSCRGANRLAAGDFAV